MSDARQHAHELIDRMPETQMSALVVAPGFEDEDVGENETRAVARSKEWFKQNQGTPFEDLVAELGFTMEQIGKLKETV